MSGGYRIVRIVLLAALLLGLGLPAWAVESKVGGWATISHHEGAVGYRLNDMNRNDNAFSGLRINPEVQIEFDGGLELNAEYLIDAGASTGLSNTFLRLWGEWEELGGKRWLNAKAGSLSLVFGTYGERANQKSNPVIGVLLSWILAVFVKIDPDTNLPFNVGETFIFSTWLTTILAAIMRTLLFTSEVQHGTIPHTVTAQPTR